MGPILPFFPFDVHPPLSTVTKENAIMELDTSESSGTSSGSWFLKGASLPGGATSLPGGALTLKQPQS